MLFRFMMVIVVPVGVFQVRDLFRVLGDGVSVPVLLLACQPTNVHLKPEVTV